MAQTTNNSNDSLDLKQRVASLYAFMAKRLGIRQVPRVTLTQSAENAENPFGLTAYYNQQDRSVRLYVTGRHPTDILRSFAHELIHHWQNEHGALPQEKKGGHAHYAQNDPILRKREMEAYLLGNILFRDWQDENRYGPVNENLKISDPDAVQQAIKRMLFDLIKTRALTSFHRDLTSGDMDPKDFVDEIARKLELELQKYIETVNNRGNWENQPNMIREKLTKSQLKEIIMDRIFEIEKKRSQEKGKATANDLLSNHKAWIRLYLAQKDENRKKRAKYYFIGFENPHFCWYWDAKKKKIVAKYGKDHLRNFGPEEPYKTFRGRYDVKTNELSVTIPEQGEDSLQKFTGDPKKDLPPELLVALEKTFPGHKLVYFPFVV